MTVITTSTWFRRSARGSVPPTSWASWSSVAWAASAATIPVTVIEDADRARARRGAVGGRPPAARGAGGRAGAPRSRSATGVRRGGRAASARAWTVLVRAARTAGTKVATAATASATAVTAPTVDRVSDGAPARPRRPAPGSVSRGAASHPAASPAAAASRARTRYSASSTTATRRGVPPTALSRPTRRVWSAIRPPTSTAMLATASRPSSRLPIWRTRRWSATTLSCPSRMCCQDSRTGVVQSFGKCSLTKAGASVGSANFKFTT